MRSIEDQGQSAAVSWLQACWQVCRLADELRDAWSLALAPLQLAWSTFWLLWHCQDARQPLVQKDLAAALALSPAQVSVLLEGLRERGLVECQREAADRRRQAWRITVAGQAKLQAALEVLAGSTVAAQNNMPFEETLQQASGLLSLIAWTPQASPLSAGSAQEAA